MIGGRESRDGGQTKTLTACLHFSKTPTSILFIKVLRLLCPNLTDASPLPSPPSPTSIYPYYFWGREMKRRGTKDSYNLCLTRGKKVPVDSYFPISFYNFLFPPALFFSLFLLPYLFSLSLHSFSYSSFHSSSQKAKANKENGKGNEISGKVGI